MLRQGGLTLCGADAHPCALVNRVLPAVALVIVACLASSGGWARLTLAVSAPHYEQWVHHRKQKV